MCIFAYAICLFGRRFGPTANTLTTFFFSVVSFYLLTLVFRLMSENQFIQCNKITMSVHFESIVRDVVRSMASFVVVIFPARIWNLVHCHLKWNSYNGLSNGCYAFHSVSSRRVKTFSSRANPLFVLFKLPYGENKILWIYETMNFHLCSRICEGGRENKYWKRMEMKAFCKKKAQNRLQKPPYHR